MSESHVAPARRPRPATATGPAVGRRAAGQRVTSGPAATGLLQPGGTDAVASFVAAHEAQASLLGERLADLIDDPPAFLAILEPGLRSLVDPAHQSVVAAVSPGTDGSLAIRGPLREALMQPLRRALRQGSSASALWLAQTLARADHRDLRLYALPCLRRSLQEDPERSWQLLRRMAGRAGDWIEVDSLAEVWAVGVLAEGFRWAELEQLVYSARPYERRLVGATLATLPHRLPPRRRGEAGDMGRRAMELVALLMGDAEEVVQRALSWAIRNWTRFTPQVTAELLLAETDVAVREADGARAWVIRDSLSHQPPELGGVLRERLTGLRRDPNRPSTSIAASQAARFAALIETHDAAARQGGRYARSRT